MRGSLRLPLVAGGPLGVASVRCSNDLAANGRGFGHLRFPHECQAVDYYPRLGFTRHESAWVLRATDPFPVAPA